MLETIVTKSKDKKDYFNFTIVLDGVTVLANTFEKSQLREIIEKIDNAI